MYPQYYNYQLKLFWKVDILGHISIRKTLYVKLPRQISRDTYTLLKQLE